MVKSDFNCGNCKYFRHMQIMGLCRLYPLHQNKHESDWCGQHQEINPVLLQLPVVEMKKRGRPKKC